MQKEFSPFTPGIPVGVELFVGRARQISNVSRRIRQAASGRQQNVFLIGDRGVGKSSFASIIRRGASGKQGMVGVHVFLGGVHTLEELTRKVLEELVQEGRGRPWYDQVFQLLGRHIKEVGLLGIKVAFQPSDQDLSQIVERFPDVLGELITQIGDVEKGVCIVMDDINGLAETPEFARWYKGVVDSIATQFGSYPVLLMLCGTPDRRDLLVSNEPSLMRIFDIVELGRLSDEEVSDFFERAFEYSGMTVDDNAIDVMVHYSSGLPAIMQEIGEATFWEDSDGRISLTDAVNGVRIAADNVGRKYLEPRVLRALRSPRYQSIVRKLGESIEPTFTRRQIRARLTTEEGNVFDNLRARLQDLGVIEQDIEQGRGAYRFTNQLYPVYLYMESQRP